MTTILVAEDEPRISSFLAKGLSANGYAPMIAGTGTDALDYAERYPFDLLLLDIGLPGVDGFEVLRRVRERDPVTPIIMLTARTGVEDIVAGLDGGANDYLPKPFRVDELLARIRSSLRDASTVLSHGDLSLDLRARTATIATGVVELSAREFSLAEEFLRHPGEPLSREHLLSRVWGFDFDPGSNVVDDYVRYLREKLGARRIESVRGVGYRMP